jgi:hypothetical protein
MDAMVKADWLVHPKLLSKELGILYGSFFSIIHGSLGYHTVSCQWMLKLFYDLNRAKKMISLQHLRFTPRRVKSSWILLSLEIKHEDCISLRIQTAEHDVEILQNAICWEVDAQSSGITEDHSCWISCHKVTPSMRTAIVAHLHFCELPSGKSAQGFSWTLWFSSMTMPGLMWQTGLPPDCRPHLQ